MNVYLLVCLFVYGSTALSFVKFAERDEKFKVNKAGGRNRSVPRDFGVL
jgi:hypothetical protein